MRTRLNHIIAVGTLVSYILVGAVGFWGTLGQAFLGGTNPYVLTKSKSPATPAAKIVWTQKKHFPSTSRDDVPAPAVLAAGSYRPLPGSIELVAAARTFVPSFDVDETHSPRSPPRS